jgi:hypothetical protein
MEDGRGQAALRKTWARGWRVRLDPARAASLGLPADAREAAEALAACVIEVDRLGTCWKRERGRAVYRVSWHGGALMMKRRRRTWLAGMGGGACGAPARAWRGALRLEAAGSRALVPVALLTKGREQVLVAPWVEAPGLDQYLRGLHPAWLEASECERRRIATAVGTQVGRIARAGWVNRDHKLSNLLVDARCAREGAGPIVIDADGVVRRRGRAHGRRMLTILRRSLGRTGPTRASERLRCLRAALRADPTLGDWGELARALG